MKSIRLALVALAVSTGTLFSFNVLQISPAGKAVRARAISLTETSQADIQNGAIEIKDVKAGTSSVIIEAEAPYVNTRKKDVL